MTVNRNKRKKHTFCYAHVAYTCRVCKRIKVTAREVEDLSLYRNNNSDYNSERFPRDRTETTEKFVLNACTTAVNVVSRKSSSPCLNRRTSFVVLRILKREITGVCAGYLIYVIYMYNQSCPIKC